MTSLSIPLSQNARLREMTRADAPAFHELVTDPQVGQMLFVFPPDWSLAEAGDFLDAWQWRGSLRFRLAIEVEGDWAGWIGAGDGAEPEIFYALRSTHAGRGLARAAVMALSDFVFQKFAPAAVTAEVFTDNPASARVLEACGFARIGDVMAQSRARLAPAPAWVYRLSNPMERPDEVS